MTTSLDVAIIGAGASGLSAAIRLKNAGFNLRVLEARDRVGGRVHSLQNPDLFSPVELGAEFVHGMSEDLWSLIRAYKASAYEVTDDHLVATPHGLRDAPEFWEEISKSVKKVEKHLGGTDMNLQACLKENLDMSADEKQTLTAFVEGFHAADPALMSTKALVHEEKEADETDGSKSFRLINGYDYLFKSLARDLDRSVLLSCEVQTLEWEKGRVRVHCGTDIFEARAALITLPVSLLKTSTIFQPPLTPKAGALGKIEMGQVIKILLNFKKDILPKKFKDLAFLHDNNDAHFSTWWSARPIHLPILTGWAGGKKAQQLSSLENSEILTEALHSFSKVSGVSYSELQQTLQSWHVHNWQTDPFSLGAYSYVKEGGFGVQKELAKPIEETLFFAGEATQFDDGQIGTVDGAIASGRRAAAEILKAVSPISR